MMTDQMDKIDQQQQLEIKDLQNKDKIHEIVIYGISFIIIILLMSIMFLLHTIKVQEVYIDNLPLIIDKLKK